MTAWMRLTSEVGWQTVEWPLRREQVAARASYLSQAVAELDRLEATIPKGWVFWSSQVEERDSRLRIVVTAREPYQEFTE